MPTPRCRTLSIPFNARPSGTSSSSSLTTALPTARLNGCAGSQYVAFLYLTRASGLEAWKKAGQKLAECIRLHPRTLLTRKTWHLLFAWSLLQLLPVRGRRPAVITLLRIYGRWSMFRRPEVARLVEDLERSGLEKGRVAGNCGRQSRCADAELGKADPPALVDRLET
jgi:hypothetical protein